MKTFNIETALSVADDLRHDFDEAETDFGFKKAVKYAKNEIQDLLNLKKFPKSIKITDIEFIEFDSGNISHAGAYYNVEVEGPDILINQVRKRYDEEYG